MLHRRCIGSSRAEPHRIASQLHQIASHRRCKWRIELQRCNAYCVGLNARSLNPIYYESAWDPKKGGKGSRRNEGQGGGRGRRKSD
eukprot:3364773-Pyramimonas_sp.AAC.1